jgi:sulfur relay (sulfurtransferase) complex TusBCD TusD component (DsrE family)
MAGEKTLTFVLMDPPYETARSTTALRLVDAALRKGLGVNVFAYEGAVNLAFAKQQPHPNAVHGRDVAQENHPTPKDWVAALQRLAQAKGTTLDWVQCGMCVDERGAAECIPGLRRGSPGDLVKFAETSDNTLVIPAR